jgi:hypothetical protein
VDRNAFWLSDTVPYQIRVQGSLDDDWRDYLGGHMTSIQGREGEPTVTTLVTPPVDQAALAGLINSLYSLRLRLLSVRISPQATDGLPME